MKTLTYEVAHDLYSFDASTGEIRWKNTRRRRAKVGEIAGDRYGNGYRRLSAFNVSYLAHRVAWLMHYGVWPDREVDHINGVRDDNRICNLRLATSSENKQNAGAKSNSKSGFRGVTWFKAASKWRADISVDRKQHYLGSFDAIEDAVAAYAKARAELHPFRP